MKKTLTMLAAILLVTGWCGLARGANLMSLPKDMQGRYQATHFIDIAAGALFEGMATNAVYTNVFPVAADSSVRFVAYELITPFSGAAATNTVMGDATVSFGTVDDATAFMSAKQCGTNSAVYWYSSPWSLSATSYKTTVNYAATNNPTVTVTPLTTTLNYAGTNAPAVTVTLTPLTLTFTNVTGDLATTNVYTVLTGVTASATASVTPVATSVATNATATATLTAGSVDVITNLEAIAVSETTYSSATNLMVSITPADGQSLDWATAGRLRLFIQKRDAYGR